MADDSNGNTRPPHRPTGPGRIFHDIFLTNLNERDEPLTALAAVRDFAGEDYEVAVVPEKARAVLSRFDERSQHYELRAERSGIPRE